LLNKVPLKDAVLLNETVLLLQKMKVQLLLLQKMKVRLLLLLKDAVLRHKGQRHNVRLVVLLSWENVDQLLRQYAHQEVLQLHKVIAVLLGFL
jgi:hypothetical protein